MKLKMITPKLSSSHLINKLQITMELVIVHSHIAECG